MKKFINSSISPNLEKNDVITALKLLLTPYDFFANNYVNKVESWFKYNFSKRYAYTFSSAREAEYALLSGIGIGENDEVAIQAFTCIAVINPILWLGAKPVYVDINNNNLSMNIQDLEKKITKKTKAIILQYTFGMPAEVDEIKKLAKRKNIFLIEDCAHVIGGLYKNKKLGQFGDAAFFSFGRDKAVSSVFGGIVITGKKNIAEKIKKIRDLSPYPSAFWIYQQLMHPISTSLVIKGFNTNNFLGKLFLYFFKKAHLISLPILPEEKISYIKNFKTRKYPNPLAAICFSQLLRINRFNKTRLELYKTYRRELGKLADKLSFPKVDSYYLRIPITVKDKKKLIYFCREKLIYLGDWYSNVVDPKDVNLENIFYKKGSCPTAEKISQNIINLPCYPTMDKNDAKRVSDAIKLYYENK